MCFPNYSAKPHLVLVPYPAQGHFPPMIYLAKKLAELGCAVTIVNLVSIHEQLSKEWGSAASEMNIRLEALHPELPMPRGVLAAFREDPGAFHAALSNLAGEFQRLVQTLIDEGGPVSCILSDHYVGDWPLSTAIQIGVPHAVYWPGSAAWFAVEYNLSILSSKGDLPPPDEHADEDDYLISYLPGIKSVKRSQLPWQYKSHEVVEYLVEAAERLKKAAWILCNTVYELEPEAVDAMKESYDGRFIPVGPLFPVSENNSSSSNNNNNNNNSNTSFDPISGLSFLKEDNECLDWLDKQEPRSILYIAFGSIANLSQEQFQELVCGLESSGVKFMLAIRPQLIDGLQQQSDYDDAYSRFVERTRNRNRSLIISWAPQRAVLRHPAVGGFLTHCGWNSVMEGVTCGVPLLCWPCMYEQGLNAKFVEENFELGAEMKRDKGGIVRADEVERVIGYVFNNPELRDRAQAMSRSAKSAAEAGASFRNLVMFVQELTSTSG